ncbi:hypothetical protein BDQ12DRAFT_669660 [Crucibulum laeve]|uniref:Uncharacterized protein n=1 Tax=Crucibulum laeve TaxID=68775 RepID=A0A5C3LP50_9AGAR|nr:hypothetical protein BDQ12DRAFT_669660 [Crucibulum laeve]
MATPRRVPQWSVLRYLLGRPKDSVLSEQPLSNPPPVNLTGGERCWSAGGGPVDCAQLHQNYNDYSLKAGSFLNALLPPTMAKQFEHSVEQTRLGMGQSLKELGALKQLAEDEVSTLKMMCARIEDLEDAFKNIIYDVDFLTLLSHNVQSAATYAVSSSPLPPVPADSSLVLAAMLDNTHTIAPTSHSNPTATPALDGDNNYIPPYTVSKGI